MRSIEWEHTSCNLCGSIEFNPYLAIPDERIGRVQHVRCTKYQLIYMNPRPTFAAMTELYTDEYYSYSESPATRYQRSKFWLFQAVAKTYRGYEQLADDSRSMPAMSRTLEKLAAGLVQSRLANIPHPISKGKLLDVGCGRGDYLDLMQKLSWDTFGVEISRKATLYAREQGHKVTHGTLESAAFPSQSFDVVTFWHVLEHVYDPVAELLEARRILKPDGYLALGVPNIASPIAQITKANWNCIHSPYHLYFFTPTTLSKLLDRAGFCPASIVSHSSPQGLMVSAIHVLSSASRISRHTLFRALQPFSLLTMPLVLAFHSLGWGDVIVIWAQKNPELQ